MTFQLENSNENNIVLYAVIAAVVFFIFILPGLEKKYVQEEEQFKETMKSLKSNSVRKLDTYKCSRDCCLHTQWPVPHMPKRKSSKYIASNFMCNGNGGGCLCVTKKDKNYLARRGRNFMPCSTD